MSSLAIAIFYVQSDESTRHQVSEMMKPLNLSSQAEILTMRNQIYSQLYKELAEDQKQHFQQLGVVSSLPKLQTERLVDPSEISIAVDNQLKIVLPQVC